MKYAIFGCTKTDGKHFQILQGNEGCENQNVKKNEEKETKQKIPTSLSHEGMLVGTKFRFCI